MAGGLTEKVDNVQAQMGTCKQRRGNSKKQKEMPGMKNTNEDELCL